MHECLLAHLHCLLKLGVLVEIFTDWCIPGTIEVAYSAREVGLDVVSEIRSLVNSIVDCVNLHDDIFVQLFKNVFDFSLAQVTTIELLSHVFNDLPSVMFVN